ncbi:unnamed protein product [Heligmosomoides polygyrus]|uniref:3-hydroxyisobutyryl-CoA hydrolase n=1 Tax=Heligmosomoides polygyrus TaxID=6339 RepID=A0A183G5E4_HELPZ|nr:unnamed protein product [Heligmosomoides polygyrus]
MVRLAPISCLWRISARLSSTHMCPELAEVLHRWKGGEVELTSSGDVVRLRLNRPEKSNCLSGEMMLQIGEKLRELEQLSSGAVLVVEGKGRSFCSGADLGLIDEQLNFHRAAAMLSEPVALLGFIFFKAVSVSFCSGIPPELSAPLFILVQRYLSLLHGCLSDTP